VRLLYVALAKLPAKAAEEVARTTWTADLDHAAHHRLTGLEPQLDCEDQGGVVVRAAWAGANPTQVGFRVGHSSL
jgi:hypothetical protein